MKSTTAKIHKNLQVEGREEIVTVLEVLVVEGGELVVVDTLWQQREAEPAPPPPS